MVLNVPGARRVDRAVGSAVNDKEGLCHLREASSHLPDEFHDFVSGDGRVFGVRPETARGVGVREVVRGLGEERHQPLEEGDQVTAAVCQPDGRRIEHDARHVPVCCGTVEREQRAQGEAGHEDHVAPTLQLLRGAGDGGGPFLPRAGVELAGGGPVTGEERRGDRDATLVKVVTHEPHLRG